jgi:hypothetical protein
MDQERHEVYERIPWEVLEKPRQDHGWLVMALAGAVAVGALAYSFTRSQPADPAPTPVTAVTSPPPVTADVPAVIPETELFAVDGEQILDRLAAHAAWFAVEFIAYDGSAVSAETLGALLPEGVPLPEAPEGTQVFVDWAGVSSVSEIGTMTYRAEVVVRSLASGADGGFIRQPPLTLTVEMTVDAAGLPQVTLPPTISATRLPGRATLTLTEVPADLPLDPSLGSVLGGRQGDDGTWRVVSMVTGPDGVTRPQAVPIG